MYIVCTLSIHKLRTIVLCVNEQVLIEHQHTFESPYSTEYSIQYRYVLPDIKLYNTIQNQKVLVMNKIDERHSFIIPWLPKSNKKLELVNLAIQIQIENSTFYVKSSKRTEVIPVKCT